MSKTPAFKLSRSISAVEAILGMMACLSIILILAPKSWTSKTFDFDPTKHPAALTDDHYAGGSSSAEWVNEATHKWRCVLSDATPNPYCNLTINVLSDTWRGIDLRNFNKMKIYGSYEGEGEHIRIYLRNRHPAYYKMGNDTSTKYNMVEIPVKDLATGFELNMRDFGVADWWLASNGIPLEYSHAEFNDIIFIEVQTGSQDRTGSHTIQVNRIEWQGNILSDETLYKLIVIIWCIAIFVLLLYRIINLKIALSKNERYQKELISINSFLNLQNKQFEDLAKTDQLTGLYNRIGIRDALYESLQAWKDNRVPFSFILIDIDHFKQINDSHGHDIGDKILESTAKLFTENVRRSDYLARWGGEEFILVCPNTDINQAQIIAEVLRKKLEGTELHKELTITASFGVSTMTSPDLDETFKTADEALYEAKAQGRNRVVVRHQT